MLKAIFSFKLYQLPFVLYLYKTVGLCKNSYTLVFISSLLHSNLMKNHVYCLFLTFKKSVRYIQKSTKIYSSMNFHKLKHPNQYPEHPTKPPNLPMLPSSHCIYLQEVTLLASHSKEKGAYFCTHINEMTQSILFHVWLHFTAVFDEVKQIPTIISFY